MHVFVISYDLKVPGRDYASLYDAIKKLGDCQHPLESTWLVASETENVESIYEKLKKEMDDTDLLLIFDVTGMPRQGWLARSFWEWMKDK